MKINSVMNYKGKEYPLTYFDIDEIESLEGADQIYAVCFCDGKVAIVYHQKNKSWVLPGGTPETGEKLADTLRRELMEEANIELINFMPIGYQVVKGDPKHHLQVRVVATGNCLSEDANDPAGDITKIKLIDIDEVDKFIDWGEIGKRVFERAKELYPRLLKEKGASNHC